MGKTADERPNVTSIENPCGDRFRVNQGSIYNVIGNGPQRTQV